METCVHANHLTGNIFDILMSTLYCFNRSSCSFVHQFVYTVHVVVLQVIAICVCLNKLLQLTGTIDLNKILMCRLIQTILRNTQHSPDCFKSGNNKLKYYDIFTSQFLYVQILVLQVIDYMYFVKRYHIIQCSLPSYSILYLLFGMYCTLGTNF